MTRLLASDILAGWIRFAERGAFPIPAAIVSLLLAIHLTRQVTKLDQSSYPVSRGQGSKPYFERFGRDMGMSETVIGLAAADAKFGQVR